MRDNHRGVYVLAERTVRAVAGAGRLEAFARDGRADTDVDPFSSYTQVGPVFTGRMAGRPDDPFAVSWTQAGIGGPCRQLRPIPSATRRGGARRGAQRPTTGSWCSRTYSK